MSLKNSYPVVAIVGPPNAGKSSLLNKIAGKPIAVTSDIAGTTRDRQYLDLDWNQKSFTLVDTAGLAFGPVNELETNVQKQIEVALQEADAIILVVDGKQPSFALEQAVLKKFRKIKKPTILAVSKLDSPNKLEEKTADFLRLGIKPVFPVSAVTGRGIGDMLDCVAELLPKQERKEENVTDDSEINISAKPFSDIFVSIVGKPNVGKSSIFNKLLNTERAVVSSVPGTTRTAVDEKITINGTPYTFIDTAGLKKKDHNQEQPDIFSGFQTYKSIRRSDVCLFVIDANAEITKQDQRVAQEIFAMEKGCVILANKIDAYSEELKAELKTRKGEKKGKSDDSYQNLQDYISHHFPFLWMSPVFFVSAKTGEGLNEALLSVKSIFDARNKTVSSELLKTFLDKKLKTNPPKLLRDQKKPKVFSLHQTEVNPPTFELYVNHPAAISLQFRKFLENAIVKELDFWGTPILLKLRGKDKA